MVHIKICLWRLSNYSKVKFLNVHIKLFKGNIVPNTVFLFTSLYLVFFIALHTWLPPPSAPF